MQDPTKQFVVPKSIRPSEKNYRSQLAAISVNNPNLLAYFFHRQNEWRERKKQASKTGYWQQSKGLAMVVFD